VNQETMNPGKTSGLPRFQIRLPSFPNFSFSGKNIMASWLPDSIPRFQELLDNR